ncbi:MAG: M1 family metallopeptidase [Bacteroidetes bacterium]|nr:M1 family metallopeptidase [Bacteroidota bacterium]
MLKNLIAALLLFLFCKEAIGQKYTYPQDNFRTAENKYYWKNRPPYLGYWQQDVHYTIEAEVLDSFDLIVGNEWLTYYNNSPDTLTFAYFHLYQNAFQPGSYLDGLTKENNEKPVYGESEKNGFGTLIKDVYELYYQPKIQDSSRGSINPNRSNVTYYFIPVKTEYHNTIMKVYFNEPLLPHDSIKFKITFNTYFDEKGGVRRRMKLFKHDGVKHYDGVHWYPRISVYDHKFGWTTDQHLGKEFYGDYGTYDVSLTLPHEYVLEATGILQNPKEALPDDFRQKIDLSNFKKRPEKKGMITQIVQPGIAKRTWRFHAENVHDFAWTADPSYRMGETEWNGIKIVALAQEGEVFGWQPTPEFIKKVIQCYSKDFGMYAWPKIVVADARDGMEYPMLTLCGGTDPGNHFVIAHEVGHEWFFGMIGNNETYRALLDEGFTQFLTEWSMKSILGEYPDYYPPKDKYIRRFSKPQTSRERSIIQPYIRTAMSMDNTTLNTHSDDFNGALGHGGGYGQVYYKTATMLYNLQYTLGDELFQKAMSNYFNQWKICHPYPEDFRNSIINYTHADLNWFFDEWLETNKTIDYGIKKVHKDSFGKYTITFTRNGKMQMPLDFTVFTKGCKKQSFHIPNDYFVKMTDATILPMWLGWDKVQPEYKTTINVGGKITNIIIDTTWRLADANMLNNFYKCPVRWRFDSQVQNPLDRRIYEMLWRPDIWYNSVDGIKAGLHFSGNYFMMRHIFEATIWGNTGLGMDNRFANNKHELINFSFSYRDNFFNADRDLSWFANARLLDGLYYTKLGIEKKINGKNTLTIYTKTLYRNNTASLDYLLLPNEWNTQKQNNTLNVTYQHPFNLGGFFNGTMNASLKSSSVLSDYSYTTIAGSIYLNKVLAKSLIWKNRFFASCTSGSNVAPESQLYLAGANPEEMMENKFTRSRGFVPEDWMGYGAGVNHFHAGGGLNLRGYAGYLAPEKNDSGFYLTYKGTSGLSINSELEFISLPFTLPILRWNMLLTPYAFYDAGKINYTTSAKLPTLADVRMDAGVGTTLSIKSWGRRLQKTEPFTLRFDVPFFMNSTPKTDPDHFKFRWVVGLGRAF